MYLHPSRRLRVRCASGALGLLLWLAAAWIIATPSRGSDYVLLQNGNVIRGTAATIGPMVVIRRDQGNELKLDARQVAHIAPTLRELYEFRVAGRRIRDAASWHNDARWCFRNGLYAEMAEALDAAHAFDPSHPETARLRRQLQVALDASSRPPLAFSSELDDAETHSDATPLPTTPREPPRQKTDDELMSLNLASDALSYFTSRVQPILINRCGNNGCHRSPSDASWQLTHMGVQVRPPARMTRLNLVATLELIDQEQPDNSQLLQYAVQPHGGRREPPLRATDDVALEALRQWTQHAIHSDQGEQWAPLTPLGATPIQAAAVVPTPPPTPGVAAGPVQQVGFVDDVQIGEPPLPVVPPAPRQAQPIAPGQAPRPMRLPPVENPFDPAIFNRHYRQPSDGR